MNTIFITLLGGLLLFLLFLIIGGITSSVTDVDITDNDIALSILTILVMICFGVGLFLDIKTVNSDYTHTHTATEKIIALTDNPGINGNYYVRRGYVESQMYYNYMVKLSDNSYIANQVPVRKATIYETDGDFRIEWWKKEKGYFMTKEIERYWKVYIPKNSILSEYDIDLQ